MALKDKDAYNAYMREYMNKRYHRLRQEYIDAMGGKCVDCPETENLEFDHQDAQTKTFNLAKILTHSKAKRETELAKCVLRCTSCHDAHTKEQWQSGELVPWNKGLRGEYFHGTARMYHEQACRCDKCKKAKRLYRDGLCTSYDIVP